MKRKTRWAVIGTILGLALLCLGASNPLEKFTPPNTGSMKGRVEELEKQNAALQQQVADLNRKLNILSQRVNAGCGGGGEAGAFNSDGGSSGYMKEAPGLSVVRLQPEGKVPGGPGSEEPKGRLMVQSSSNPEAANLIANHQPLPGTNYVPLPDPALAVSTEGAAAGPASPAPAPVLATPAPAPSGPKPAPSPNEVAAYDDIRALVAQSKLDDARPLMESYLQSYPGGSHEAEVANWLGMNLFTAGDYAKAIENLKLVTDKHYESAVAPDALYIIGLCYFEQNKTKEAGDAFRDVKKLYPFSKAAQLAETKLATCCQ
jgi:TolA-binding protein